MKIAAYVSILLFAAIGLYSCGPSVDSTPKPVTLVDLESGKVTNTGGTHTYQFSLSCGCPFLFKVTAADTLNGITYDFPDFVDTIQIHGVTAKAAANLPTGTYIGSLTFETVQPLTTELLQWTVRDTLIVP